eukprot:1159745-Pelagomonas_calceolata.AAC.3
MASWRLDPACDSQGCSSSFLTMRSERTRTCLLGHKHLGVVAQGRTLGSMRKAGRVSRLSENHTPWAKHHALRRESGTCEVHGQRARLARWVEGHTETVQCMVIIFKACSLRRPANALYRCLDSTTCSLSLRFYNMPLRG